MNNRFAKKFLYLCVVLVLTCKTSFSEESNSISGQIQKNEKPTQAELRKLSLKAYEEKNSEEVLKYLTQAVDLYPENPNNHLNLGDYAYQLAVEYKQQSQEWEKFAHLAENMFLQTIEMKDQPEENFQKSGLTKNHGKKIAGHAAFLLGQMYHRLFDDTIVAKKYYELAQSLDPSDRKIQIAIDRINQSQAAKTEPTKGAAGN